jgi:soluble lytic murein transglycosylase-like protein
VIDSSTIEARKQLVSKYATKYLLDVSLVCAVIEHESSWDTFAYRYEPGFFTRYVESMRLPNASEAYSRSASWGLMQIMGQTARELGFVGKYLSSLCNPEFGIDFGCKKLRHCLDRHPNDEKAALLEYNGGSDSNYPFMVLQYKSKYY